jgi:hypothetical protein
VHNLILENFSPHTGDGKSRNSTKSRGILVHNLILADFQENYVGDGQDCASAPQQTPWARP